MSTPDINLFNREVFGSPPAPKSSYAEGYDLSYLLPKIFRSEDLWSHLLDAVVAVTDKHVHAPLATAATIRVPESQGRIYKILHAKMMGYPMASKYTTDAAYDRLNNNIGEYLYEQGKDNFIAFLGYVMGMKLALVRLWTKDYITFSASPGANATVFNGGDWYPTTHVGVVYDTNDNVSSRLRMTEDEIIAKFYETAPIDLVLKWIARNQTIMLGTLYLQLLTMTEGKAVSRIDTNISRTDMVLQELAVVDGGVEAGAPFPMSQSEFGVVSVLHETLEDTFPVNSTIAFWEEGEAPELLAQRNSPAWVNKGVGGQWVPANVLRVDNYGIVIENDSVNYVRSSTDIASAPWRQSVNTNTMEQIIALPAGTYTAQAIYAVTGGRIEVLGAGRSVETGDLAPLPEFYTDYDIISTHNLTNDKVMATNTRQSVTFTIGSSSLVRFVLPEDSGCVYAGVEQGTRLGSPVFTSDCDIEGRNADVVYKDFMFCDKGAFALRVSKHDAYGVATGAYPSINLIDDQLRDRIWIYPYNNGLRVEFLDYEFNPAFPTRMFHDYAVNATSIVVAFSWYASEIVVRVNGAEAILPVIDFKLSRMRITSTLASRITSHGFAPILELGVVEALV